MAKQLKLRRGTTSQHGSFTGAEGEVTVDTDKETLVVHDGSTAGGHPVAAEDMANVSSASITGRLGTGSIATAKIADEAITLAKLEHGTSSNNGKFLRANNGADPSFETVNTDLVADTSPQLGGNLDLNSNDINGTGNISVTGSLSGTSLTTQNGNIIINSATPTVSFVDSDANPDYEIKVNGGEFDIRDSTNSASKFKIDSNGEVVSQTKLNCQAGLDTDGDVVFNSDTTNVGITFDASSSNLNLSDSQSLSFGDHSTTGDYQLSYVSGGDFTALGMNGGSGDLVLGTFASGTTTKTLVSKRSNNALELYFANSKKLETVTGGVTVTGTCTATAFAGDGSALTGVEAFPSGTKMLFQQTAAPTGWTKVTSGVDNKALRVVSGTVGSGGNVAFTTVFGSRGLTATAGDATAGGNVSVDNATQGGNISIASVSTSGNVNSHTLTTSEMPSHNHSTTHSGYQVMRFGNGYALAFGQGSYAAPTFNVSNAGGGGGHSHGFTGSSHNHNATFSGSAHNHNASFSGSAHNHNISVSNLDMQAEYLDVIIAAKD